MRNYSYTIPFFTILTLTFLPIILWLPTKSGGFTLLSLSQAGALAGTVLFSINFVLSTRVRFLERCFGGLNRMYIIHHQVGKIAFALLILHPVALGIYYLGYSLQIALTILLPPLSQTATWMGILALSLFDILLILTLFVKLPYDVWKNTHKLLGVPLFFASLHIFFIESTVSYNLPLRYYMLAICGVGITAYLYKTLLVRFFVPKHIFTVKEVRTKRNVTNITMEPESRKIFSFIPGQFIFVKFLSNNFSPEEHPFSLISSPDEKEIEIAVKSSGDYTSKINKLKPGSHTIIEGPFGHFSHKLTKSKKQIWIAGGIGITPFISMAKSLLKGDKYDIVLYYVVKGEKEATFFDLLKEIANRNKSLKLVCVHTKRSGRITAEKIINKVADFKKRSILICGPAPMMKDLRLQFNKLGVGNHRILSEEFSLS